jgi:DNA polymerase III subunit epsilon
LQQLDIEILSIEGEDVGDWVLIDTGELVIHVINQDLLKHYKLIEMWGSKPIDLFSLKKNKKVNEISSEPLISKSVIAKELNLVVPREHDKNGSLNDTYELFKDQNKKRIVFLDTETTGLSAQKGERIIEIACTEMIDGVLTGNVFHEYINPNGRQINKHAQAVHGINQTFLTGKPYFESIVLQLIAFCKNSEIVIHNAPFDIGFLNFEFSRIGLKSFLFETNSYVTDTLLISKNKYSKTSNSLNSLCDKFNISRKDRVLHGALVDTQLLAQVYLKLIE